MTWEMFFVLLAILIPLGLFIASYMRDEDRRPGAKNPGWRYETDKTNG